MDFKNINKTIIARVLLLTVTCLLLAHVLYKDEFIITKLLVLALLVMQVLALIKYMNKTNTEVMQFLNSIQYDDLSYSHSTKTPNTYVEQLYDEFNKVLERLKDVRKEKEADFQYLKNIVQHVGIGLVTFDDSGKIQMMNTAARKLLKTPYVKNIKDLSSISDHLVDSFLRLKTGGHDLIKVNVNDDIVQLAVYAIELTLRDEQYKLVSLQNIQNELEEKEMEAWQNLVRVLTHEIMNSVTPISSLAGTVEEELRLQLNNNLEINQISNDAIEELHLAVKTIQRRSVGLIRFVQDFRNLTHIPKPVITEVNVNELLVDLVVLHKKEAKEAEVTLTLDVDSEYMIIQADKSQIEQVMINLIKNAIQSFDEQEDRIVSIRAYYNDKNRPVITVKDNGNGIDEEALEKIFIPFFTTKKNGSGIGLSLSRQIMRQHQGVLGVKTKIDEGTEFSLRF
ncbi:MAG: ATP-binding protein [Cyclobacteriaceae bacterium]|nr:ATP-binding protein [Cyclobacteriaceae bacterium]